MRAERAILLLSFALNLALAAFLADSTRKRGVLEGELARQAKQNEELTHRIAELESAAKSRAANQSAASAADVLELARLRSEVTRLRNEQRAVQPKAGSAPVPKAPASNPPPQASLPGITTLTASLSADVGLGHALAMGGWESTTPGRRIVGLITPELNADSPGSVMVTARLLEFPDATMEQLGLHALRTDQTNSQSQALFTAEQLKALLARAESLAGTDILATPRVITGSGRAAQLAVTQAREDGSHTGPVISLTPTLNAAGNSVRLEVGIQLNLPPPAAPAP